MSGEWPDGPTVGISNTCWRGCDKTANSPLRVEQAIALDGLGFRLLGDSETERLVPAMMQTADEVIDGRRQVRVEGRVLDGRSQGQFRAAVRELRALLDRHFPASDRSSAKPAESPESERDGCSEHPRLWGELADLCERVHEALYAHENRELAREDVEEMVRILEQLPSDNKAIVFADACALVAEFEGRLEDAAKHRRREIALTLELHQLVKDGKDDPAVLVGRDEACLEERRRILGDLLRRTGES